MAIISIQDTHRLPYIKGKFTAVRLGAGITTPVKFYDADGIDLGYEIYTNSEGFVCDRNGNLLGNGVFVHVDSVISAYYDGGKFSQWVAKGYDSGLVVNDGKLRNAEGQEVWSANSALDYTLQWSDIANRPAINMWSEDEQVVTVSSNTSMDSVVVDKYTKILNIGYDSELQHTQSANLVLSPQPSEETRYGQVIFVQTNGDKSDKLNLWNQGDSEPLCTIPKNSNALLALMSDGKFVCLQTGSGTNIDYSTSLLALNTNNIITEDTPALLVIRDLTDGGDAAYTKTCINASALGTKSKKFILLWEPSPTFDNVAKKVKIYGNANQMILEVESSCELLPYKSCEVLIGYNSSTHSSVIVPLGYVEVQRSPVAMIRQTALSNDSISRVILKSAATVIDLGLFGGSTPTPETKKVFGILVTVPPNYEGDITIMNSEALTHLTNFEIQVGFECKGTRLSPGFRFIPNPQNLTDQMTRVYRSRDIDGSTKGKFFALFHVISYAVGGIYVCHNPETEI